MVYAYLDIQGYLQESMLNITQQSLRAFPHSLVILIYSLVEKMLQGALPALKFSVTGGNESWFDRWIEMRDTDEPRALDVMIVTKGQRAFWANTLMLDSCGLVTAKTSQSGWTGNGAEHLINVHVCVLTISVDKPGCGCMQLPKKPSSSLA